VRKIDTRNFRRATRGTLKEVNKQIALNLVREHQPISRAGLARLMSMNRGDITKLVGEMIGDGALIEGAAGESPRGRKPTLLHVRTHDRLVAAIDVRYSQTYVALSDFSGRQIADLTFPTIDSPEELADELARRVRQLLEQHGSAGICEGIGLVVPGMIDRRTGRVLFSPQLGWRDVDICAALAARTALPVHVENAPIACALAHMWLSEHADGAGLAAGARGGDHGGSFVYVTVSDGIGAGIVVNGEVLRGHTDTAGEFGHIPIDADGPQCLCGLRGCLETRASNLATLLRYLGRQFSPDEARVQLRDTSLTIADLIRRARGGDERAAAAFRDTGHHLGTGLSMVVAAINPARIIVGGEITHVWDVVEPEMRAAFAARTLTPGSASTPIIPEPIGGSPRLRGATALIAAPAFAAPRVG